jgi:hypothetical protein
MAVLLHRLVSILHPVPGKQNNPSLHFKGGKEQGMGVKDLWQLLAPAGRYSSLESLKHKRIAIGTLCMSISD